MFSLKIKWLFKEYVDSTPASQKGNINFTSKLVLIRKITTANGNLD